MKLLISALLASAAVSLTFVGTASATPASHYETQCTSYATSYDPPSGTYVAPDGTKWAGNRQNGNVPESLVSSGSSTVCTQVLVEDVT